MFSYETEEPYYATSDYHTLWMIYEDSLRKGGVLGDGELQNV